MGKFINLKSFSLLLVFFFSSNFIIGQSAGGQELSLKQRLKNGEKLISVRVPTSALKEEVQSIIAKDKPDFLYLDAHHSPCTEWDIARICAAAKEKNVGVLMRIDHADQAGMISSMLDLGLLGVKVPSVEDEETVDKIIDGFYYPPIGKRSMGGSANWGEKGNPGESVMKREPGTIPYNEWWNKTGILAIKIETVQAVLNVRFLAKPGIDFVDIGSQDLTLDIEIQKHPGFETLEDCLAFMRKALKGTGVRLIE